MSERNETTLSTTTPETTTQTRWQQVRWAGRLLCEKYLKKGGAQAQAAAISERRAQEIAEFVTLDGEQQTDCLIKLAACIKMTLLDKGAKYEPVNGRFFLPSPKTCLVDFLTYDRVPKKQAGATTTRLRVCHESDGPEGIYTITNRGVRGNMPDRNGISITLNNSLASERYDGVRLKYFQIIGTIADQVIPPSLLLLEPNPQVT